MLWPRSGVKTILPLFSLFPSFNKGQQNTRTSIFVIFCIMFCSVISKLPISDYLVATKLSFKNDGMRSYKVQYFDIVLVLLGSIFYNRSIIYIHQKFLKVVVHVIIIDY